MRDLNIFRLYYLPRNPTYWVVADDRGGFWYVPPRADGWRERVLYEGPRADLEAFAPHNPADVPAMLRGLGVGDDQ